MPKGKNKTFLYKLKAFLVIEADELKCEESKFYSFYGQGLSTLIIIPLRQECLSHFMSVIIAM